MECQETAEVIQSLKNFFLCDSLWEVICVHPAGSKPWGRLRTDDISYPALECFRIPNEEL